MIMEKLHQIGKKRYDWPYVDEFVKDEEYILLYLIWNIGLILVIFIVGISFFGNIRGLTLRDPQQ